MEINQNSGEVISLQEAQDYTKTFQAAFPNDLKSFFVGINKLTLILEQLDCIGVRIYNGYSGKDNAKNLVLVGVGLDGEDLNQGVFWNA
ncbi:hypothetical protein [Flavobacterium sp. CLA17]|uniref:hypothetical protein n=1 Tax=Flavobacterium sp. CLA17 TaxID=2724135 RepID=UPI001F082DC8|nr:hypothetical protein [Flavobacterium sp. CLA17]